MSKKQIEIKLSPLVLKKLRETSGYSVKDIAKNIKTSVEKVMAMEKVKSFF